MIFDPEFYAKTVKSGTHAKITSGLLSDDQLQTIFGACLLYDNGNRILPEEGKELLGELSITEWIEFAEGCGNALQDFLSHRKKDKR